MQFRSYFTSKTYQQNQMRNPQSAKERFKNHLAYQLGLCALYFYQGQDCTLSAKNGRGGQNNRSLKNPFCTLQPFKLFQFIYTLLQIIRQHKKQQRIYRQTIAIFPSLKYPALESCEDYFSSLRIKYHLAYLIGETLIQANKALIYGGYLKLPKEIKKQYKLYTTHQKYQIKLQTLNLPYYFIDNLQSISNAINSLNRLEEILKNTQPQTRMFLLKHWKNVMEWLQGEEFKSQYLDTNHPYPPLLNPNRLNKDSTTPYPNLNYDRIPAKLAWEMNLPLPTSGIAFVYWGGHGTGNTAFKCFMRRCGGLDYYCGNSNNAQETYEELYRGILLGSQFKQYFGYLSIRNYIDTPEAKKYYTLIPALKSINLTRDPISSIKHYIAMRRINFREDLLLKDNPQEICQKLVKYERNSDKPSLETLEFWLNFQFMCFHDAQLYECLINLKNTIYMDMSEIVGEKTFDKLCQLSKILEFTRPKIEEKAIFAHRISHWCGLLPLTLRVSSDNQNFKIHLTSKVWQCDDRLYIKEQWNDRVYNHEEAIKEKYTDITTRVLGDFLDNQDERRIYILSQDYPRFITHGELLLKVSEYMKNLIKAIDAQDVIESQKKLTEQDVLEYLKNHSKLRKYCKKVLDTHLSSIKKARPDIVKSWKYYQEFEKMCAEMD